MSALAPQVQAVNDVLDERLRQERLKRDGRFAFTCADAGLSNTEKLAVLMEEVGEVARAVLERGELVTDKHGAELRKELVQVAAIALAWVESLT